MYHLQNICCAITEKTKEIGPLLGKSPYETYRLMFKTVLHSAGYIHSMEVEGNPFLSLLIPDVKKLISEINLTIRKGLVESSLHLREAIEFIEKARCTQRRKYIILCDAFSLPEYLFTIYVFAKSISVNNALCSINPSGKTATFKYLAREYLRIKVASSEEIVMRDVDNALQHRLSAASRNRVFRDIDNLIHYRKFDTLDEVTEAIFKILVKLHREITIALNQGYTVLLIADHGYDILESANRVRLTHRQDKDKICLSPFVPLLLIGN